MKFIIFYLKIHFHCQFQDDRSPLSSGDSSDESSSVEVAGPSHHIQEPITRRQRQQPSQQPTPTKKQEPQKPPQSIQVRDELGSLNSLLYPPALVNLPQEVLMNLVQSGHLQVEEEGNDHASFTFHYYWKKKNSFANQFSISIRISCVQIQSIQLEWSLTLPFLQQ